MRSEGIRVTDPISIYATPEEIGLFETTDEENALFIRTMKIPKNVVRGGHREFVREFDIYAEFGINESEIMSCRVNEVA